MKGATLPYDSLYHLKADFHPEASKWNISDPIQCYQLESLLEAQRKFYS
jgi:hypothetical protein